jgi:hypothetical protein
MVLLDLYRLFLMQIPYTCKQEDPLPNGGLYLPKQLNTLSKSPLNFLITKKLRMLIESSSKISIVGHFTILANQPYC